MKVKVSKWGNSLGLRIPVHIVSLLKLKAGEHVNFIEKDGVVELKRSRKRYDIDELLDGITDDNIHGEHLSVQSTWVDIADDEINNIEKYPIYQELMELSGHEDTSVVDSLISNLKALDLDVDFWLQATADEYKKRQKEASGKIRIDVEDIFKLEEESRKINKPDLNDIDFYENGKKIEIPQEYIDEYKFTGLSNFNFITDGFYKGDFGSVTILVGSKQEGNNV